MYGIYANIWGILMVNVTIYGIHGSYGCIYIYILETNGHPTNVSQVKLLQVRSREAPVALAAWGREAPWSQPALALLPLLLWKLATWIHGAGWLWR